MYCSRIVTRYGSGIVCANERGVVKVEIPNIGTPDATQGTVQLNYKPSDMTDETANLLGRYFSGEPVDFSYIPVDLGGLSPFRQKILNATRKLLYGEISSYGQIAYESGFPHGGRAVGGALAANLVPIIIPCHRVVAADGRLTGFSAPGGKDTKWKLLEMEGAEFKGLLVVTRPVVLNRVPNL